MARYKRFINRNIDDSDMTGSIQFGVSRFVLGWAYLGINVVGSLIVPLEYVNTREFQNNDNFLKQNMYFIIWIKTIFAKYMGVWLLADGALAITGLGYNGRDRKEWKILWDGVCNVKPLAYENCSKFMDLVESFNITTNVWCKNYVYKRCRILGFKGLSHAITLAFLAIWHGLCSGYFLSFFLEIFPITFEKQILGLCETSPFMKQVLTRHSWLKDIFKFLGRCYFLFFLPHCLAPFVLIRFKSYMPVLWSTNFLVVTVFGSWFVLKYSFERLMSQRRSIETNGVASRKKKN